MPVKAAEETSNLKPPPTSTSTEIKVFSPRSAPLKQAKCSLLSYRSRTGDSRHCLKKMRVLGRSRSRQRHPQEHLLQKIKEDFQSWQASKALESATTVAACGKHLDGRCIQIIAQENLRKAKMARYGYVNNKRAVQTECSMKNVVQTNDSGTATKVGAEAMSEETKIIRVLRVNHCAASENLRDLDVGKDGRNQSMSEKLHSPTRIVLLKPSFDIDADAADLSFGLSKVKRDGNMEEFLQEVKERLQKELKVKCTNDLRKITREAKPKHAAVDIATQLKQTMTTDLGKRLSRSEAFRAFRSDRNRNHAIAGAKPTSPEHFKINTRSILVHRSNNVTPRTETVSPQKDDEESVDSFPIRSRGRVRSLTDISLTSMGFDEQTCKYPIEKTVDCRMSIGTDILPHRKLVRSFSAPESVVSRIRLFLDESVGSRNHGASDIASESGAMTSRSNSFSFRETVSSLRHRFSFRGKMFGRKKKPSFGELYPQLAIGMSPSPSESFRLYNFPQASIFQANFAELPPSPVSPLEIVGQSSRHFFSDLNCSSAELSRNCPSEFEAPVSELSFRTDVTVETASNHDKAYLREVLIAAGLYDDGSLDNKANARVDSMARPICDYIFDEVEDIYYYRDKSGGDHDIGMYSNSGGNAMDHRMLFDLANEALQILVQGAKSGSSLWQWVIDNTGVSRGRKLVDDVAASE
ncbi:hypothetical protein PR202_ga14305 [Eleusine coracana subsp. coracana]|uniref:DUF4378 domain-containing protein n=1 Tax=Eleusine coracana subsp. coracana TaxID=191504 RepID=A0AAV5CH79_ELECO|nr:hypothetical protein PR202_ga14305 [Eleusine coracana subsp. coracana]